MVFDAAINAVVVVAGSGSSSSRCGDGGGSSGAAAAAAAVARRGGRGIERASWRIQLSAVFVRVCLCCAVPSWVELSFTRRLPGCAEGRTLHQPPSRSRRDRVAGGEPADSNIAGRRAQRCPLRETDSRAPTLCAQ